MTPPLRFSAHTTLGVLHFSQLQLNFGTLRLFVKTFLCSSVGPCFDQTAESVAGGAKS